MNWAVDREGDYGPTERPRSRKCKGGESPMATARARIDLAMMSFRENLYRTVKPRKAFMMTKSYVVDSTCAAQLTRHSRQETPNRSLN